MNILITGTAGFIGFHLVNKLIREGVKIIGVDNINDYYDVNLKYARLEESGIKREEIEFHKQIQSTKFSGYTFVRMNLEDKKELIGLFEQHNFDIVINLAAQAGVRYSIENPDAYIQSNVVGFLNILEGCRNYKIKHLVYASSSSVYGMNTKMPFSVQDSVDHPISLYAATKKSNELMAHAYSHLYNIPTTGLRFFTVYGPWGRPDMAYFLFAEAISKGNSIKVFNNGKLKRDFTYIDDIVHGIINVSQKPPQKLEGNFSEDPSKSEAPYRVYNLGNNNTVELMEFINTIAKAMEIEPKMEMMDMQPGDVLATWANIDLTKESFDYSPSTEIEFGINKFIEWYKSDLNPLRK